MAKVEILYANKSANARMQATGQVLGSLKGLFKEHSTGYKVMTAIEKAYAIFQTVQTAVAIARDIAHTASSLANSGTRTAANTAEGGSKIFAQLGWLAFPVVAAMVAVLASLGAKGGGGGSSVAPTSAEDLQAAAGTGTVLGSPKDKSASIANSLELVAANTNKDLEYSSNMLKALRSIDLSIGAMAATVAKQINVNGSLFDTSGLNIGTSSKKGFLGLFGGSTTTTSLYDLGIQLNNGTVADIIANGIGGLSYQVVQKVKTKKGFLGIGGGTKTSYVTSTGALDPEITDAIQTVILNLRNGLVAAANVIGVQGAQAMLDGFEVSIGKISFENLSGQEIEDQLNAIFSSIGDQMAGHLLPSLKDMQLVGEGMFETFVRVAKEYEAVDIALKSIGRSFGQVGIQSVAARDALVQLFGGLDSFIEATDQFRDNFLTEAERIAPVQASVITELQRLGVANVTTREQFKNLVLGLDLTTDAGRQMYASLLSVAPAFDKVLDYFDQINKTATESLSQTVDKFTAFADSLKKYRDSLFTTGLAQQNATASLRNKFTATAALAATGDATALGNLENSGKAYLDAVRNSAHSQIEYQRAVAQVASGVSKGIFAAEETADYAQLQLDALKNANSILQQISLNTQATADALAQPKLVSQPGTPIVQDSTVQNADVLAALQDVTAQLADVNAGIVSIATSNTRTATILNRWDGDGLTVKTDADTPIQTQVIP
jgi:hypothetical protein